MRQCRGRGLRTVVTAAALAAAVLAPAWAEEWKPPQVQAVYVNPAPTIDGKLDDECWTHAARLEGFFVPDVDDPLPEETVGLVCVDETWVYVGVICRDRTPDDIQAVETRRNGDLWADDTVEVAIEPMHQHVEPYFFRVNARGTQAEDIPGGSAAKIEWRGDWRAAAARTSEGWTAELAIPFSILRYPPGQTTFGLFLSRHFHKERLWVMYPYTGGKSFDWNRACELTGLQPPPFAPRPVFMPYTVLNAGEGTEEGAASGVDFQYRMLNGMTGLAVMNPDFTQIEEAVASAAFSYNEQRLPDHRPFFVTGQGFLPGDLMLYTRRIEDFDVGAKLFGTMGRDSYGFLDATSYGAENALAVQWGHKFGDNHEMTWRLVDHRSDTGADNTVYGFDTFNMRRCEEGGDAIMTTVRQSVTRGGDSGGLYNVGGFRFRGSGVLGWDWNAGLATRGFNPALGYFYDQNSVGVNGSIGVWDHYEKGRLESKDWRVALNYTPYLHGDGMLRSVLWARHGWRLRSGYGFSVSAGRGLEYDQDNSDGGFRFEWGLNDRRRQGGAFILRGQRAGGPYTYYSLDQSVRPLKDVTIALNLEYSRLEPPSPEAYHRYQGILTASYDVTPERTISARTILRDDGVGAYAAYRQAVRRGTDMYVILGDPDPDRTGLVPRLAVKVVRVF
jgi:hypothetical protein